LIKSIETSHAGFAKE